MARTVIRKANRLDRRAFPNIEKDLHCLAVKASDTLHHLCQAAKDPTAQNVRQMVDLTNLLLLIRKSAPNLAKSKKEKNKSDNNQMEELFNDQEK